MPNPFMRLGQRNTSDEAMAPDRPQHLNPVLESFRGSNHPYRGIEIHGVEDTEQPHDPVPERPDGTRTVLYDEPAKEIDPVPVKIVTEGRKELRRAQFSTYSVGNTPTRIIGRRSRESVNIKNDGPFDVVLTAEPIVGLIAGYKLPVNDSISLDTEDDIWCYCVDTSQTSQSGTNRGAVLVSSAAIQLTPSTAGGTSYTVVVRNESATDSVRIGTSANVPTAAQGLFLGPNEQVTLFNVVGALQAIRTGATDVPVSVFRGSVASSSVTVVDQTSVSSVRIIEQFAAAV